MMEVVTVSLTVYNNSVVYSISPLRWSLCCFLLAKQPGRLLSAIFKATVRYIQESAASVSVETGVRLPEKGA